MIDFEKFDEILAGMPPTLPEWITRARQLSEEACSMKAAEAFYLMKELLNQPIADKAYTPLSLSREFRAFSKKWCDLFTSEESHVMEKALYSSTSRKPKQS